MPGYDTEEIITRNRHAGSLYGPQYTLSAASEEPPACQPRLISFPGVTRSSVLACRVAPVLDVWGGQGTITPANYATDVSSATAIATTSFAQLNPTRYLDSRNITISNLGLGVRNVLWSNESSNTSGSVPAHSQAQSVLISDEVLSFCSRWQIFSYFQRALRLAQQSFLDLTKIEVKVESDPESEDEWLVIVVQVHGEIGKVLSMYDGYTRKLIRTVPWPARDRIRLIYDFA